MITLESSGVTELAITPGRYWVYPKPAFNCTVTDAPDDLVEVVAGRVVEIVLAMSCVPQAQIRTLIAAMGDRVPSELVIELFGAAPPLRTTLIRATPNDTTEATLLVGSWRAELHPAPSCWPSGDDVVPLDVSEASVVDLRFELTCRRTALRITLGGMFTPGLFFVDVDGVLSSVVLGLLVLLGAGGMPPASPRRLRRVRHGSGDVTPWLLPALRAR